MKKQINYLSYLSKYEILIASGVVLILVTFLVFNMLLPNMKHANEIYAQEQVIKKKLESLKQKDSSLNSLDYEYYKDAFLKLNQVLPEGKDYVSLINTFDLLEKQSGVSVVRTNFQLGIVSTSSANLVQASGTHAYVIPITIEIMGSLDSIGKFLELVSNYYGRLMVFEDVSVTSKGEILDASFNGRAFFYPLPTSLGSIDTPLPRLEKNQDTILKKISKQNLPQEIAIEIDKSNIGKKNLFQ